MVKSGSVEAFQEVATAAIMIAAETENGAAESDFRCRRSEMYAQLHRWADSREDLDQSLAIAQSLGDNYRRSWALNGFAILAYEQGNFEDALSCLRKALTLIQGNDSGRLEAVIEGNLSQAFIGLKRYQEALKHGERGLALRRRCGDLHGEPAALHVLARAWLGLNEHETVITLCGKAVTLGRNLGYHVETAEPLNTLATSLNHTGQTAKVITCWREAALFDYYGRPEHADQVRRRIHKALPGEKATDETQETNRGP